MDTTPTNCNKSLRDRNALIMQIMPTIKDSAVKYRWAFDSVDDAINSIIARLIPRIDKGSPDWVSDPISWFANIAKLCARDVVCARKIPDELGDGEFADGVYAVDAVEAIGVNKALGMIRKDHAQLLVDFYVMGELSPSKYDARAARKAFIAAYENGVDSSKTRSGQNSDRTEYSFKHKDGRQFIGTRDEFRAAHGLSVLSVFRIVSGEQKSSGGWSLQKEG